MKIVKLITLMNLVIVLASCNGQEAKSNHQNNQLSTDTVNQFVIGGYMIMPKLKEIRAYKMIGGANWDGFTFEKDPKIDYDKTTLLAIGKSTFFKEYFPFKFDLDKLKIILRDEFYFLCRDDKNIYYTSERIKAVKVDISNFTAVNDFVYKSKTDGKLYFLDIKSYALAPVAIPVDEPSLKHIAANYFYDKNGLYFFGQHSKINSKGYYDDHVDQSEKLMDGSNIVPVISKKYFSYNNQVFAIDDNSIKKLNIDQRKIIEIKINDTESFITDGKSIYSDLNYGYDDSGRNEKGYYGIWYPSLYSNINLQKIFSPSLYFQREGKAVVFNKYDPNTFPGLFVKIDNKNYLLIDKKKVEIEQVLFYNPETKKNEVFEEKHIKTYALDGFMQYKDKLYFNGMPVETSKLKMDKLRQIPNSNYLTDGESIIYLGNIGGYSSVTKGGVEYAVFDDLILKNVSTDKMKAVNPDLITDGISLISRAQIVKIKDLHLNVKILE